MITAVPQALGGGDAKEQSRIQARGLSATAHASGYFQLSGLPPGAYMLAARCQDLASGRLLVHVAGAEVIELDDPLVLERPAALEVQIEPPASPAGTPWHLELARVLPETPQVEAVGAGAVSPAGRWRKEGLARGTYELTVSSENGAAWIARELDVRPGMALEMIEIPVVAVEGSVTAGGEPLETSLWFGGMNRAERVPMRSDAEGRFGGYLPRAGTWTVELENPSTRTRQGIEPLEVRPGPGAERARVDIELPDTLVAGRVVDEQRRPVGRAAVSAIRLGSQGRRLDARAETDEQGLFSWRGLSPGTVLLSAEADGATSDRLSYAIEEDVSAQIELVLAASVDVEGSVSYPGGMLPGALVYLQPITASPTPPFPTATQTRADGSFRTRVPKGTVALDVVLFPPGFAVAISRVTLTGPVPRRLDFEAMSTVGSLEIQMPAQGPAVQASVARDGVAVPVAVLLRHGLGSGTVEVLGDRVVFHFMAPGDYAYCISSGSSTAECATGLLASGERLVLAPGGVGATP